MVKVGTRKQVWDGIADVTEGTNLRKQDLMVNDKGNVVVKKRGRKEGSLTDKKQNPWLVHLKKFRQENPGLSFKESITRAKQIYKKPSGTTGKVRDAKTEPVQELTRGETKMAKVSKIKTQSPKRKAPSRPKPKPKASVPSQVSGAIERMKNNAEALLKLKGQTSTAAKLAKQTLKKEQANLKSRILEQTMKK